MSTKRQNKDPRQPFTIYQQKQPAENYFKKANDIFDLGDSFPSMYCASVSGSEIVTLQSEALIDSGVSACKRLKTVNF
jgi:hypothetical protein